jgi:hypothetical protein
MTKMKFFTLIISSRFSLCQTSFGDIQNILSVNLCHFLILTQSVRDFVRSLPHEPVCALCQNREKGILTQSVRDFVSIGSRGILTQTLTQTLAIR